MAKKKKAASRPKRAGASSKKASAATEYGVIKKPRRGRIKIALCYPNSYQVAMGSLAFHHVYHLFNQHDDVLCERSARADDGSATRTIESNSPLSSFDIIAFSLSFEADLANLAEMMHKAGIPLDAVERMEQGAPLILIGGVVCMLNPEPVAPFADVISVGEGEITIPRFLDVIRDYGIKEWRRSLPEMAGQSGLYVPSLYDLSYNEDFSIAKRNRTDKDAPRMVIREVTDDLSIDPARTRVFTDDAEFSEMALVELSRGCVHGCRFCASAFVYRPPRWVKADAVAEALEEGFEHRDKAGLVCSSATDHPEFEQIREWIRAQGKDHSVASLRLDQVTPELLADIHSCGHRTLTLAPEAGGDRLRKIINKPLTNRDISRAAEMVGASKMPRLKLYFQVGLPFENANDIDSIAPLVAMVKAFLAKGAGKKNWSGKITASVNPFVPKPGTPFQWRDMDSMDSIKVKLNHVNKALTKIGGVNVNLGSAREAVFQAVVARGDRRVGQTIAQAVMDSQNPATYLKSGNKIAPPAEWYIRRQRDKNEILPWDFIEAKVAKSFLWRDCERAKVGRTTPPCSPGKCERCDACKTRKK
jgi:radical SAM superfamily enzyme YgiQ (UPF0313 family)